ncbi:MAG: hypothetical protein MJ252_15425 [archaeon]|nr:hypothetical protein [archaeon]
MLKNEKLFSEETNQSTAEIIVIVISICTMELYYLTPIISLISYKYKEIPLKNIPIIQILFNTFNCLQWLIYGVNEYNSKEKEKDKNDMLQVIYCNSIGLFICCIIIVLTWRIYSKGRISKDGFAYLFMLFNVLFQIFFIIVRYEGEPFFSKIFAEVFNCLMYLSMAQNYKNPKYITIQGPIVGSLACLLWVIFGAVFYNNISALPSLIANSISLAICLGILIYILIDLFKRKENIKENIEEAKFEERLYPNNAGRGQDSLASVYTNNKEGGN